MFRDPETLREVNTLDCARVGFETGSRQSGLAKILSQLGDSGLGLLPWSAEVVAY